MAVERPQNTAKTKTSVVIERMEMTTLLDTGSQISALTQMILLERGLKILPLRNLMKGVLHLQRTGGVTLSYKACIETNLTILYLPRYNEDVLFLYL